LPPNVTYPDLDHALGSSYYYYTYLLAELRTLGEKRFPDDLEEYCDRFSQQIEEVAELAVAATSDIPEQVF